ncbi:MAG: SGNH/GDSL hydrolase family protein [Planctomycetota bacterium]
MTQAATPLERGAASRWTRRGLALLLGLLLLELGLRAGGWMYLRGGRAGGRATGDGLTVLCVGDSNTYGLWEDASDAYPARLEALLNELVPGGPHRVVNRGVPGWSSHRVLADLPASLERHRPDLVVALAGFNDQWDWVVRSAEGGRPAWYRSLHIVRLLRLLRQPDADSARTARTDRPDGPRTDRSHRRSSAAREAALRGGLAGLCESAEAAGMPLVLTTYASDRGPYAEANRTLRAAAAELGVPLVDTAARMQAELARVDRSRAFHADDHPTALGYQLFARHLYAGLRELGAVTGAPLAEARGALALEALAPSVELSPGPPPTVAIRGEEAGRAYAVLLSLASSEQPRVSSAAGGELPVRDDALYRRSVAAPSLQGTLDGDGSALVSLAALVDDGTWSRLSGHTVVVAAVVLSVPGTARVRRLVGVVQVELP